jgi:hypothetical protein
MASSGQKEEQLEFGSIATILLVQNGRLQKLYEEKCTLHLILLSLGITYDGQRKRMCIPEGRGPEYQRIFTEILRIREEINDAHATTQGLQEELKFVKAVG